jgi:hypothetical protein
VEENEEQIEDYSETNMSQQHLWELKWGQVNSREQSCLSWGEPEYELDGLQTAATKAPQNS